MGIETEWWVDWSEWEESKEGKLQLGCKINKFILKHKSVTLHDS